MPSGGLSFGVIPPRGCQMGASGRVAPLRVSCSTTPGEATNTLRWALALSFLALAPACFEKDSDEDEDDEEEVEDGSDGSDGGDGGTGECATGADEDECWQVAYQDGIDGNSPDAAYLDCDEGDCHATYCDGYCEGELLAYGEYIECEDC